MPVRDSCENTPFLRLERPREINDANDRRRRGGPAESELEK